MFFHFRMWRTPVSHMETTKLNKPYWQVEPYL